MVDPVRDIFAYLEFAKKEGASFAGVYLSHSHADFIAGHMEMARAVGCPIYQNEKSGAEYKIEPLKDGSELAVGEATLKFIQTPGHTPDGMCALVYSKSSPETPQLMFTGDVLFVGSVGRPDLLEGTVSAAWLAASVYDSWHQRISKLGDAVRIFPAHGAGSLCGAHLSDEPYSTIGKEKVSNPYFKYTSKSEFITALLDGLSEAPQYFRHNAQINREGPPLVDWRVPIPPDTPADMSLAMPDKTYLVDLRDATEYSAGHIPGAINIAVRGRLENWVGTMVPWGEDLVLCGSPDQLKEALFRLNRVGYTGRVITMDNWKKAGLPVRSTPTIPPRELYGLMQRGEAPVIVDVRLPEEWMGLRIGKVLNLPLNRLDKLCAQLDPAEPVVTVCNSAFRSSLAVGILERRGFTKARSLDGGSEAWIKAGLPILEGFKTAGAAPSAPKVQVKLPERISAADLKRLLMDLPGTFDLVDIRPAVFFKDYSLPGAKNIDIGDLTSDPAFLTGAGPLIIVDRDGSLAMAVGGILSQKTQRPIKVLYGGLSAYWSETEAGTGIVSSPPAAPMTAPPAVTVPAMPAAPAAAPQTPPAQAPEKPKRKSAGC
jgi:rhodanese-related sulfurtransferase/glyoxylase-like metal-dependent hydrolase (beta-lactamase superfamily II)